MAANEDNLIAWNRAIPGFDIKGAAFAAELKDMLVGAFVEPQQALGAKDIAGQGFEELLKLAQGKGAVATIRHRHKAIVFEMVGVVIMAVMVVGVTLMVVAVIMAMIVVVVMTWAVTLGIPRRFQGNHGVVGHRVIEAHIQNQRQGHSSLLAANHAGSLLQAVDLGL